MLQQKSVLLVLKAPVPDWCAKVGSDEDIPVHLHSLMAFMANSILKSSRWESTNRSAEQSYHSTSFLGRDLFKHITWRLTAYNTSRSKELGRPKDVWSSGRKKVECRSLLGYGDNHSLPVFHVVITCFPTFTLRWVDLGSTSASILSKAWIFEDEFETNLWYDEAWSIIGISFKYNSYTVNSISILFWS